MTEIKAGDWVEVPPGTEGMFGMIGPVISTWGLYAKVKISIGGSRKVEAYKIKDLKPLKGREDENQQS
jgi:hypothetical protein